MKLLRTIRRIACGVAFFAPGLALAATPVFINELHYDNSGQDQGEAIEVAGPVGTDLSGWTIVLYNGSTGASYDTLSLTGTIPTNCSGMADGVVVVNAPGLQNGAPDGLALVDGSSTVVQFLSYEGSFAANDGPASGMTSTDIGVSEPGSTSVGQSLQLSGSGANYEDFTWNAPAAASFGSCNAGQTFGAPVDVPPTVASTTPADTATGVALDANALIHFSEAVTVIPGWADLTCANTGSHTLAISGSGSDYTLNPDADFGNAETCTVTIHAANVTDQDGTPDPMASDYSFSFQTVGDYPPQVPSTTPADNTSAFPTGANLGVTFSEPVTLDPNWFTLVCDSSGTHTAVQGGDSVNVTLNPDVDFDSLESCTFTIVASAVHDQDGTADAMQANVVVHFTAAASSSDYYAGVDTSSGPEIGRAHV